MDTEKSRAFESAASGKSRAFESAESDPGRMGMELGLELEERFMARVMKNDSLRKIKRISGKLIRGEVGVLIYLWKSHMRREKESAKLSGRSLSDELIKNSRNQAISKLRIAFAKMMRGKVYLMVYFWHTAVERYKMDLMTRDSLIS